MAEETETPAMQPEPGVDGIVDGDASTHLEALIERALPFSDGGGEVGVNVDVELVGPHLRLAGTIGLGRFRRLSDLVNHHDGLLGLRNATILRRNGTATRVTAPTIWVSPAEVTLIGERQGGERIDAPMEFRIAKEPHDLVFVTPGHTLTAQVHLIRDGSLGSFIESNEPTFIPLTDVRTRSLADRRITARYGFALLNRRHIVATTELAPGMIRGRTVL